MIPRMLPFTIYPKKTRWLGVLLGSLAFVAGGILMIRNGDWKGWLAAAFFGLGIPVSLIQLYSKKLSLKVSEDGIEIGSLFRTTRLQWPDISEFGVITVRHHGFTVNKMVGLNYSPEYERLSKARAVAKALSGYDGALPDTYGFSAEELAELLSFHLHERNPNSVLMRPANGGWN